jgi:hypothetical protein
MVEAKQACIGCSRPTQPGTPLYSDRTAAHSEDGEVLYLCGDCNLRAVSQFGRRITDADMRQIAARGAGMGYF